MIRETTIAVFATLVLADAGNTYGFLPDARALAVVRQAGQIADVRLRPRAYSAVTVGPQWATLQVTPERPMRPVTSSYQPIHADVFSVTYPWFLSFLLVVLGAAGILAGRESVTRFRQASTDSDHPLEDIPSQTVNRPVARQDRQTTALGPSPSGSPAPPDYSVPREMVSVSVPEGTLLLLPGRFEIVKGDSRMKEIRFVKVPGIEVVTFGRHAGETDMHVRVDSPTVGRMHANMRFAGRRWLIRNLAKTNPVVLNGERLSVEGEQELHDGDQVEIGEVTFRFRSH